MKAEKNLIVVVDDDRDNAEAISAVLIKEGFQVRTAYNVFQGRSLIERLNPDLVILDRRLPDGDGLDLCREIRLNAKFRNLLVLFLSAKGSVPEKVVGLAMGGDDYLPKPFEPEELLARVQALLRRVTQAESLGPILKSADLVMDLDSHKVTLKGKVLDLWPKEFALLQVFLENPGRLLSRQFLLERVWGYDRSLEITSRIVDATASNLRAKLGPVGKRLTSVKGQGYRWEE